MSTELGPDRRPDERQGPASRDRRRSPPLRGEPPTAEPLQTFSPTDPALLGAVSPKQLAIGFGIVASLVLLALGRSRRRPGR